MHKRLKIIAFLLYTSWEPTLLAMEEEDYREYMGLRIWWDGTVKKHFRGKYWREVKNKCNQTDGYNVIRINDKIWRRHRLVMAAYKPAFDINNKKHVIDHIDENKLNNSMDNLRVVTQSHNKMNISSVKGYAWDKQAGKWRAEIRVNGKSKHLGRFATEEEAHAAYLAAKAKYHVIVELC